MVNSLVAAQSLIDVNDKGNFLLDIIAVDYIGNRIRFHPQKYPSSKWGDPYAKYLKKYGRNKVIKMYKEYIMNKPELIKLIPLELKGKTLGCWCKPLPCHGDI
jgi:hypothetical protein